MDGIDAITYKETIQITYSKWNRLLLFIVVLFWVLIIIVNTSWLSVFMSVSSFMELVFGLIVAYLFLKPFLNVVFGSLIIDPEKKTLIIRRAFKKNIFSFDEIQKCKFVYLSTYERVPLPSTYLEIQTAQQTNIYPVPPKNLISGIQANETYYQKIFKPFFADAFQIAGYKGPSFFFTKKYWKYIFANYLL